MSKKLFICFLLLFASCAINPVTGQRELMLVSEQQEIEIGRDAAPTMKWDFGGEYHDTALKFYLEEMTRTIWQNSERPQLPMNFYIQNSSIPNAFALPGYVAITRGLLCELENEAQFAAIIGHEAGHVMARHTAQRLSRGTLQQLGLALGQKALEGQHGADAFLTVGSIGSSLLLLKYSRSQEIQADGLGVKYMARLGYDPNEALTAHEIVRKSVDNYLRRLGKQQHEDNFLSGLLSTHPRTEVRLTEIQSMINELPGYTIAGDGKNERRFQSKLMDIKRINEIYFIYDEAEEQYKKGNYEVAEQKLKKALVLNSGQAPFFNLLGFVKLQQKAYAEAQELYNKSLSIDPEFQPSVYGLGLIEYFKENYNQAIYEFKRSLALYPGHISTHFGMGKSYFAMRDYRQAIPYLRNFAGAVPDNNEVHGLLGICYENAGDIEPAVQEYRYQVGIAPNTDLGRFAKKRLAVLQPLLEHR